MNPTVLIFRADLLPPSETFIAAQARALRRFSRCFTGLHLVPCGLPLDPCETVVLTSGASLIDKLRQRLFIESGASAPDFLRALERRRPVLLHAHFAVDAALALPLHKQLNLPLLVTLHGYDITSMPQALRRSAAGRVFLRRRSELIERASFFVCVSEHIHQQAIEHGFPEAKLRTLPIGVDLDFFRPDPLRSRSRDPIVLFVGRLVEKKGCSHLIRAMSFVQKRRPEAKLVIVGDGPLMEALHLQAREELGQPGADGNVGAKYLFLGSQPPNVVRDLMYRASVLAAPSVVAHSGDTEGLPINLCEAQAIGLPIVAFRGPGVAEAIVENETALLANPARDAELAQAICTVLDDPALALSLAAAGRRRAEEHFSLAVQTARLEELYLEALG